MIHAKRFMIHTLLILLVPIASMNIQAMDNEYEERTSLMESRPALLAAAGIKLFAGLCLMRMGALNFLTKKNALIKERDESGAIKIDATGNPLIKKDAQGNELKKGVLSALNPFTPIKDLKLKGHIAKLYTPGITGIAVFASGIKSLAQALGFIISPEEERRNSIIHDLEWQ